MTTQDTADTVYQTIILQVTNVSPGAKVAVVVATNDAGQKISWSTGKTFSTSAGIQVASQSGSLPLQQMNITSGSVTFLTSSAGGGGGALQFTLQGYLAATNGIYTLTLASQADPNVLVTASIGGAMSQVVNATPTLFYWNQQ
ncbi:MAG: hypothetical protein FD176_862 [Rhodospirillaceae bacterium]|nr:MAG: hypothetical protein FD176_862 [Rhodospirillaceae bacterium]TNC97874.1 MAG: hypothetical protein FD119_862 [Stygiobacter sp.]